MEKPKAFLLRIDRVVLGDVRRWAEEDLRSLNGQIEYLLRNALVEAGRVKKEVEIAPAAGQPEEEFID